MYVRYDKTIYLGLIQLLNVPSSESYYYEIYDYNRQNVVAILDRFIPPEITILVYKLKHTTLEERLSLINNNNSVFSLIFLKNLKH